MNAFIAKVSLSLLLMVSFSTMLFAGHTEQVNQLTRTQFLVGASINVTDPQLVAPIFPGVSSEVERSAFVAFVYGREDRSDVEGDYWTATIDYTLEFEGGNEMSVTGQLEIAHQNGAGIYEALDEYQDVPGEVLLTITGINYVGDVPNDIRLELRLNIDRYWDFNAAATTTLGHNAEVPNQKMTLYWDELIGAEEYELEWVFMDQYDPSVSPDFDQSIRIRLENNHYEMDMAFPEGKVYYRVRGIGRYTNFLKE